ncbi:hypothetical protein DEU56DRAFT_832503 [Suillus clintonianus]|uniref:uncharacterized protein n=1 Tax=Suillus clintonianus TaxID=1904413 RepID=UPI001B862B31|nr:uncharacterized protein DEU56DRAFT_832503 [Suillus clintonianus]KAG2122355.1 hypothetical protein DEU56DRAFT_832503 [Suillus clintonianus]
MRQVSKAGFLQTSFASYSHVMKPITTFPFSYLPVELVLIILRYYAQPTFDQTAPYSSKSPYSNARALCHFSRAVRRTVLPGLLHTILLGDNDTVRVFVHALHMQKMYAEKANHLRFDYIPHVHKIWIGPHGSRDPPPYRLHRIRASGYTLIERPLAISLLSPVLLAAPSIALDWTSMDLLEGCLEHAWKSRAATHANNEHSPLAPPWNTKTLILSYDSKPPTSGAWWGCLTDTPQGSAFLQSISHLSTTSSTLRSRATSYCMPLWMEVTPWASFKSLQIVSLPYLLAIDPLVKISSLSNSHEIDVHVELLTLPASLLRDHHGCIPKFMKKIKALDQRSFGEEIIQSDGVHLKVLPSGIVLPSDIFWLTHDWRQKVWASML